MKNIISSAVQKVRYGFETRGYERQRSKTLAEITHLPSDFVKKYITELSDTDFIFEYVREKMARYLSHTPSKNDFRYTDKGGSVFFPCVTLYALVRLLKPAVIVETGGTPGKSSAAILRAILANNLGKLYTLDLPPVQTNEKINIDKIHAQRPQDDVSCWAIPPFLRINHELILGDTKQTLKPLLEEIGTIDIFIHDSLHTYDHMMFEFKTAWDFVKPGGIIMSDDVTTNSSFEDFAKRVSAQAFYIGNYGIIVKGK